MEAGQGTQESLAQEDQPGETRGESGRESEPGREEGRGSDGGDGREGGREDGQNEDQHDGDHEHHEGGVEGAAEKVLEATGIAGVARTIEHAIDGDHGDDHGEEQATNRGEEGEHGHHEETWRPSYLPIQEVGMRGENLWAPPTDVSNEELMRGEPREVENGDLPRFGVEPAVSKMLQERLEGMDPDAYVDIKPGSEDAMDQRVNGAIGKMEWVKPKSMKQDEWMVGVGERGNEGLATLAQPKLLERPDGMGDEEWADRQAVKPQGMSDQEWQDRAPALQNIIDKRQAEYDHYQDAIERLGNEPTTAWHNGQQIQGVVKASDGTQGFWGVGGYQRLGNGVLYMANHETGEMIAPLSGDVDGFTVHNPGWGEAGSDEYKANEAQFWNDVSHDAGGIFQHEGNTVAWQPPNEDLAGIRSGILREYASNNPEGQNVLRITAGGAFTARGPAIGDDGSVLDGPYANRPPEE